MKNPAKVVPISARRRPKVINLGARRRERAIRSFPWHLIFAASLRDGTASPEIVKAAEGSRREWDARRARVRAAVAKVVAARRSEKQRSI